MDAYERHIVVSGGSRGLGEAIVKGLLKSGYLDGNVASARAQKAAGYREVGRWHEDRFVDGQWKDHILTELMREDWEKSRV